MQLSLCPLAQWNWVLELLPRSAVHPTFETGRWGVHARRQLLGDCIMGARGCYLSRCVLELG